MYNNHTVQYRASSTTDAARTQSLVKRVVTLLRFYPSMYPAHATDINRTHVHHHSCIKVTPKELDLFFLSATSVDETLFFFPS